MRWKAGMPILALVALLALWGVVTTAASPAAEEAALKVEMSALQVGDTITYSIALFNTTASAVGDIFIAGLVPKGATFGKATQTPAGSWFRGVEGGAAVWLSSGIAARGKQGPFSYQVTAAEAVGPAHAWVRWRVPAEGVAMSAAVMPSKYAGSEACSSCHNKQYNQFRASAHPYMLRKVADAKAVPIPLPAGYTWDDISYVAGGNRWKVEGYVDRNGYIITKTAYGEPGKNQYNILAGTWSDSDAGQVKRYTCGECHTTGYSKEGSQDNLPGIVGTWAMEGIQCEECHGPGNLHIAKGGDKSAIKVDRSAAACGKCHIRGDPAKIPGKDKEWIRHHEQYNELVASPHKALGCTTCHNPHARAEFSIKAGCETCHSAQNTAFAGSTMQKVDISCVDCHMPKAVKSGQQLGPNTGDLRAHLFKINIDPAAKFVTDDGAFVNPYLTLRFACLGCHRDKDVSWAAQYAKGVHSLGK